MNDIIRRLKIYRIQCGFSQQKIASLLNISQSAYAKIESGITRLDIDRFDQICKILNIDPEVLIYDDKEMKKRHRDTFKSYKMANQDTIRHLKEEIIFLRRLLEKQK